MPRLPEFMKNMGNGTNQKLLINEITAIVSSARKEIEEQAKYYNLQWKIDMITQLKKEAIALYQLAIDEANSVNADYEKKIAGLEAAQYEGARINKDDTAALGYELKSLKAELNMTNDKNIVIDKYLASKIGAKAVLMLFADKDVDLGIYAHSIYSKAFMKSKTQAELDFEIRKQDKINSLKLEQSNKIDFGSLLAAQRIMQGNPTMKMPSLENMFDEEIRQTRMAMNNERSAIKEEVRMELMREGASNNGKEMDNL